MFLLRSGHVLRPLLLRPHIPTCHIYTSLRILVCAGRTSQLCWMGQRLRSKMLDGLLGYCVRQNIVLLPPHNQYSTKAVRGLIYSRVVFLMFRLRHILHTGLMPGLPLCRLWSMGYHRRLGSCRHRSRPPACDRLSHSRRLTHALCMCRCRLRLGMRFRHKVSWPAKKRVLSIWHSRLAYKARQQLLWPLCRLL